MGASKEGPGRTTRCGTPAVAPFARFALTALPRATYAEGAMKGNAGHLTRFLQRRGRFRRYRLSGRDELGPSGTRVLCCRLCGPRRDVRAAAKRVSRRPDSMRRCGRLPDVVGRGEQTRAVASCVSGTAMGAATVRVLSVNSRRLLPKATKSAPATSWNFRKLPTRLGRCHASVWPQGSLGPRGPHPPAVPTRLETVRRRRARPAWRPRARC